MGFPTPTPLLRIVADPVDCFTGVLDLAARIQEDPVEVPAPSAHEPGVQPTLEGYGID